ncbi:MAG: zinc ribbon domain-containing protein [Deltaproteobacteria bacterium]|nr:zinc ribbon domain-containing protein [Deltaproteobacteria bacterium]
MPIYEYVCIECGHHFEKLQKSGVTCELKCPTCGSMEVKKEISAFSSAGSPSSTSGCASSG